ncbi:MAG: hypothetical protein RMJ52_14155, partial [Gemmataceae bacterium]|nr:hypothetical protein [Gemmataceae bacterium]
LGLLLRPQTALAVPSFAWLRLLVAPLPVESRHRRLRVEVVRCRGGRSGPTLLLEIDDATGAVRLLPELAAATVATPPAPAAAAAGRAG